MIIKLVIAITIAIGVIITADAFVAPAVIVSRVGKVGEIGKVSKKTETIMMKNQEMCFGFVGRTCTQIGIHTRSKSTFITSTGTGTTSLRQRSIYYRQQKQQKQRMQQRMSSLYAFQNNNSLLYKYTSTSTNIGTDPNIVTVTYNDHKNNIKSRRSSRIIEHKRFFKSRLYSSNNKGIDISNDLRNDLRNDDKKQQERLQQEQQLLFLDEIKSSFYNDIIPTIFETHTSTKEKQQQQHKQKQPLIILLAISGGCDSIALFHSMIQLLDFDEKPEVECKIHVVHFDHKQRGVESDNDRKFVQRLCEEYNIPFHCFYWGQDQGQGQEQKQEQSCQQNNDNDDSDGHDHLEKKKFSQEIARNWRRKESLTLLNELCSAASFASATNDVNDNDKNSEANMNTSPPGIILTAHHKDDTEETMMMKFLRGVHITNLSGMDTIQQITLNKNNDDENNNQNNEYDSKKRQHSLYLGKPMLGLRKSSIYSFLSNQGLEWREDKSNETDKYLRNRVRHQLMPLLQELVGGEDVLGTRLKNLEEQSHKVRDDVTSRAEEYLDDSSPYFTLPPNHNNRSNGSLNLVEEEALHQWVRRESHNSIALSYEKVAMVSQQLLNFPERRQWKLSLGSNWFVERNGDILELKSPNNDDFDMSDKHDTKWIIEQGEIPCNEEEGSCSLDFCVKEKDAGSINFSMKTVEGNEHMKFIPPWRQQGASQVKIKEFLRGQKIPLHQRGTAPILCMEVGNVDYIAAVYVENTSGNDEGKWITNGMYTPNENDEGLKRVLIRRI
jgi:tRNA(Ile)-lysidine synthase TilS/MesJ